METDKSELHVAYMLLKAGDTSWKQQEVLYYGLL